MQILLGLHQERKRFHITWSQVGSPPLPPFPSAYTPSSQFLCDRRRRRSPLAARPTLNFASPVHARQDRPCCCRSAGRQSGSLGEH